MNHSNPATISVPAKPLSPSRRSTLDGLLALMFPASQDGQMPAATSLGLFDDLRAMPKPVRESFEQGLDRLESTATGEHGESFHQLSEAEANSVLDALKSQDAQLLNVLTLQTTARYLQHDQVVTAIGMEARPHWPQGHTVPDGDWQLLEPVRARGEIWRKR